MIDAISQLLESPVAYHAVLAKALRSVPAAVMLSQGIYWQRQAEKAGRDTFWMTIEGWYEQTGITPESQNTARRVLRNAGFWHEMLVGMPAKTHYRIDVPALVTVITGYLETGQQVTVDHRNKPRLMPRTSHGKYRQHSTVVYRKHETPEITTETSFETTGADAPTPQPPASGEKSSTVKAKTATRKETARAAAPPVPEPLASSLEFMAAWTILLDCPKWKKKTTTALAASLKQLERYPAEFASELVQSAIAANWQGVVFPDTPATYAKWQKTRNPQAQQATEHSRPGPNLKSVPTYGQ